MLGERRIWARLVRDLMTLSSCGRKGTCIEADIKVGVSRFSVDTSGFVSIYEDIHVQKGSIF